MKKSKKAISTFKISFSGLKEGSHKFDFEIYDINTSSTYQVLKKNL